MNAAEPANANMTVDPTCSVSPFEIVSSQLVYNGFVKVWRRTVQFPTGVTHDWDVAGHMRPQPAFVVVFPYFTSTKTTRLLSEYSQGTNEMLLTFPCGGVAPNTLPFEAARHELSEEAQLCGGRLVPLLPAGHRGISELKWGTNRFLPYIVVDPVPDPSPRPMDTEEYIRPLEKEVPVDELMSLICEGSMMMPSVQTAIMALKYITDMGDDL